MDLFYDNDATLEAVASGTAPQRGDFVGGTYEARIRRNPDRIQVQLLRDGNACGVPVADHQGPDARRRQLDAARSPTCWRTCPPDRPLHFAVEMNFAGLPADADGRNFCDIDGKLLGPARLEARSGRRLRPGPDRRVAGHRRGPEDVAAHQLLDLPHRDGQPIGRRLRAGPPVGGGACRTGWSRPTRKAAGA